MDVLEYAIARLRSKYTAHVMRLVKLPPAPGFWQRENLSAPFCINRSYVHGIVYQSNQTLNVPSGAHAAATLKDPLEVKNRAIFVLQTQYALSPSL